MGMGRFLGVEEGFVGSTFQCSKVKNEKRREEGEGGEEGEEKERGRDNGTNRKGSNCKC